MRISNGFDRMSTDEELHQVFGILGEMERNGSVLSPDNSSSQANGLWANLFLDDPASFDSLAELVAENPGLKN